MAMVLEAGSIIPRTGGYAAAASFWWWTTTPAWLPQRLWTARQICSSR